MMLDKLKSVQNKNVYDHLGTGMHSWDEQRYAEYDAVLEDMCTIAQMTTDKSKHERHFFRNVFNEQVGQMELDTCDDPNAPLKSRATACTLVCDKANCMSRCKKKKGKKRKRCQIKCKKKCKPKKPKKPKSPKKKDKKIRALELLDRHYGN